MRVVCDQCGAAYRMDDHLVGRSFRCKCGKVIRQTERPQGQASANPPSPVPAAPPGAGQPPRPALQRSSAPADPPRLLKQLLRPIPLILIAIIVASLAFGYVCWSTEEPPAYRFPQAAGIPGQPSASDPVPSHPGGGPSSPRKVTPAWPRSSPQAYTAWAQPDRATDLEDRLVGLEGRDNSFYEASVTRCREMLAALGKKAASDVRSFQFLVNIAAKARPSQTDLVRQTALDEVGRLGPAGVDKLLKQARMKSRNRRQDALQVLSQLEGLPADVVPVLAEISTLPDCAWLAVEALAHMAGRSEEAAAALEQIACTGCAAAVQRAVDRLDVLPAAKVVPILAKVIRGDEQQACMKAIRTLGDYRSLPEAADVLTRCLSDKRPGVALEAVKTLGLLGQSAKPGVPALAGLLAQDDPDLRKAALAVLEGLGPAADGARAAVIALLDDQHVYREAACALGALGPAGMALLLNRLREGQPSTRTAAAEGLGQMGAAGEPARQALVDVLVQPASPAALKDACAFALGRIGPKGLRTVMDLHRKGEVVHDAELVGALGGVTPLCDELADELAALSRGAPTQAVRRGALEALARLSGRTLAPYADYLLERVQEVMPTTQPQRSNKIERKKAVWPTVTQAIGRLAGQEGTGPALTAKLLTMLTSTKPAVRAAALESLQQVPSLGVRHIPALIEAVQVEDRDVTLWSARTLAGLGPAAIEAVPYIYGASTNAAAERDPANWELGQLAAAIKNAQQAASRPARAQGEGPTPP